MAEFFFIQEKSKSLPYSISLLKYGIKDNKKKSMIVRDRQDNGLRYTKNRKSPSRAVLY